jgi:predicted HTH transcriptional regulator
VRLGSTNRLADAALISELGRRTGMERFDEQPVSELDSEAIDFVAASQCFAERRSLRRQDLAALGLVSRHQGRVIPTAGGLLLFGQDRLSRFPDAYIQAGRTRRRKKHQGLGCAISLPFPADALPGLAMRTARYSPSS